MRSIAFTALLLFGAAFGPGAEGGTVQGERDLFTSKVRPILARHCFKCHGPDEKARKRGSGWTCATRR